MFISTAARLPFKLDNIASWNPCISKSSMSGGGKDEKAGSLSGSDVSPEGPFGLGWGAGLVMAFVSVGEPTNICQRLSASFASLSALSKVRASAARTVVQMPSQTKTRFTLGGAVAASSFEPCSGSASGILISKPVVGSRRNSSSPSRYCNEQICTECGRAEIKICETRAGP